MVVEESKWNMEGDARLFDGEKYCILGFYGKHLGLSDRDMHEKGLLTPLFQQRNKDVDWLTNSSTWDRHCFTTAQIMMVWLNDRKEPLPKKKEAIGKVFKQLGVKIEWR